MRPKTTPIRVYAAGGFNAPAKYGAWAFYIPLYGYEESGSAEGSDSGWFEMKAVIQGIKWVISNHASPAPIQVMTDCALPLHWILELNLRLLKKSQRTAIPPLHEDLIIDLEKVLKQRSVSGQRASSDVDDASDARCHHVLTGTMAIAVQSNPTLRARVAQAHPGTRLDRLLFARQVLYERLASIDEAIAEVKPPPLPENRAVFGWLKRIRS